MTSNEAIDILTIRESSSARQDEVRLWRGSFCHVAQFTSNQQRRANELRSLRRRGRGDGSDHLRPRATRQVVSLGRPLSFRAVYGW
jgi:hypothetical protein